MEKYDNISVIKGIYSVQSELVWKVKKKYCKGNEINFLNVFWKTGTSRLKKDGRPKIYIKRNLIYQD